MIRLATRGSALALAQANWVAERFDGDVELVPVTTSGDRGAQDDKSRFVKELEEALLAGAADIAVHSAKDVPADLPVGLVLSGVPERADPRDALCGAAGLEELPEGAVVGTASLRRRAELLAARPDLDVREVRGNVDTRLRRLADGDFHAIVLAQAGLDRLDRGDEGAPLPQLVPAAGQGCLALETRADDDAAVAAARALTDPVAERELTAERTLVAALGASCHTPIGVHATESHRSGPGRARPLAQGHLTTFVGLPDGSHWIHDELEGDDLTALAVAMVERLEAAGARELLAEAEGAAAAG